MTVALHLVGRPRDDGAMSAAAKKTKQRRPPGPETNRGPGVMLHLYLALSIHCALLVWAIYGPMPRELADPFDKVVAVTLAVALFMTSVGRYAVQDWYSAVSVAGKFLYLAIVFCVFWIPEFWEGHRAFPEGFALALPAVVFTAVGEPMLRRVLLWTTLGFWSVCAGPAPPGPGLLLGFGFTLMWCFGASHFAFTGHPFGLKGWWPARKVLQMTALYFVPAAAMATLVFYLWPDPAPRGPRGVRPEPNYRQIQRMDAPELVELVVRAGISMLLLLVALLLLYYIRRRLARRAPKMDMPNVMLGDVGGVGYEAVERIAALRGLGGRRGEIVRMWSKWSQKAAGEEVRERGPAETAEELAARLSGGGEHRAGARGRLTELFERAHYDAPEPTPEDVRAMKQAVEADLAERRRK